MTGGVGQLVVWPAVGGCSWGPAKRDPVRMYAAAVQAPTVTQQMEDGTVVLLRGRVFYGCFLVIEAHGGTWSTVGTGIWVPRKQP